MIIPTQIINTEIFAFIADLVLMLFNRKLLLVNSEDNGNCQKVGYFLRK